MKGALLAAGLAVLTACGSDSAGTAKPCTLIGTREGIGLDIAAPYAAKVSEATMKICWNGACREPEVRLMDSTTAVPQPCTGDAPDDVCGASASPDGGKTGFADLAGLPTGPVQVTLTLRDASGERLLARGLDVTPHATYPNGKDCGKGAPQAKLAVTGDGRVTVR
ncbi:hypothetical protein ACFY4C_31265 [Actinomadura viridis]|uniref:hypothetical protein n=1 Tax=Actinomadura viridis TaxID=58110 RepID=UPI0036C66B9A